ncbi:2-keto-3-deoxygluconate kinase [Cognatiyoonia koreensis]|uniref:2-keto-3-deoxygluconate kinase n=1 Tax=Cognatiyoonia koreensis TaxID=364200 RepID=A0A1I0RWZ6_9RHOB|nr:sugar kinase [Cognatiyoonia koreensis]SEW45935.1 2-keto-3-deoxygluconate kinase [Cognatiyoonia koreensis]
MRVLAIGECMAELAPTDKASDFRLGFAGDTFNTAWYLARCAPDVQVSYLTAVGDDAISEKMRAFMRESGIGDRFVQVSPNKTVGLYLISLDQGERSFSYWRGQSAARTLADDPALLADAMDNTDLIYFSGITLAILSPDSRATLLAALREARAGGKSIAFDPNLRPRLWTSDSEMTQTIMQGAAVSDIALPSFEDEAEWFNDASPEATAARYRKAGATTIIVKNGAAPVRYVKGDESGEVTVTPVKKIVDTTAAGDSFNAGVFAGHASGAAITDCIGYACALSRVVVQQRGALVSVDLSSLPKIKVT